MLGVPYYNYLGAFRIPDYTMLGVPYYNYLGSFILCWEFLIVIIWGLS